MERIEVVRDESVTGLNDCYDEVSGEFGAHIPLMVGRPLGLCRFVLVIPDARMHSKQVIPFLLPYSSVEVNGRPVTSHTMSFHPEIGICTGSPNMTAIEALFRIYGDSVKRQIKSPYYNSLESIIGEPPGTAFTRIQRIINNVLKDLTLTAFDRQAVHNLICLLSGQPGFRELDDIPYGDFVRAIGEILTVMQAILSAPLRRFTDGKVDSLESLKLTLDGEWYRQLVGSINLVLPSTPGFTAFYHISDNNTRLTLFVMRKSHD
ncbi:MAG: hypothetical protein N3A71_02415 [Candidatus Dojkabacteria bacterium]|nr:hypothetical protein [Candidatus Dojkabacteria bacterium]